MDAELSGGAPMNMWGMAWRQRSLLVVAIAVGMIGAAVALIQPLVIRELIAAAASHASVGAPIAAVGVLFSVDAILMAVHAYLLGRVGENIVFDIRRYLIGRLLRADLAAFRRWDLGDLQARMVTDSSIARMALSESLAQILTAGLSVTGALALMAWIDLKLFALTVISLGVSSLVCVLLARNIRVTAIRNRDDTGQFAANLHRVFGALTTVKASRAESAEEEAISKQARAARDSGVRTSALMALLVPTMNLGTQISIALVVALGMAWVATDHMPAADLTAFLMYLFYLITPLVTLFLAIGQLQQGRAAIKRVTELAALPEEDQGPRRSRSVPASTDTAAVEFDNVTFGYDRAPVLQNVCFITPLTGLVAVIGPSGAGKTTLLQLLERFYQPAHGAIRLFGQNINDLPLHEVRKLVGYVEQDIPLLRGTIHDNLTYAAPTATDTEIGQTLALVGLTDVVADMPHGLATPLGDRGAGLSGGEQQRLAIARTLLQKPKILLLDEATAHLDSDTETRFRHAVSHVAQERAVIMIAHRLSTVIEADTIIVMDAGRIHAIGTHADLMETNRLYQRLVLQQTLDTGAVGSVA
ncbi:ABC transporter ATP-binding protein [Nocardia sp. NPDC051570]|uniref:ABC transporter ATP-binding protein n=1 Tax=Nocardia sp. NPDC051570 TaxID=3364324 RepID=UPI00378DFC86